MGIIIQSLYSGLVFIGDVFIYLARYFSPKIKLLFDGRKNTWKTLEDFKDKYDHVVWVHCASLGEFEQGRPLIEKIKASYPENTILLSFFSPSGYEIMKTYSFVDEVIYLPSDSKANSIKLIKLINPKICIFVKYEFWWNLIDTVLDQKVKLYLISGVFRESDYFFKPIFKKFKSKLATYDHLFVQDEFSGKILLQNGITNFSCVGDTRIDRVIQRSNDINIPETLIHFCIDKKVIVYGSVWMSDMSLVSSLIREHPDFIHIIAPHDIANKNIEGIRSYLKAPSDLFSDDKWRTNIVIINNIGLLSSLYSLARYAYIGGGFKNGIHNILEPAVFKIPVFFGTKYQKFNEATSLVKAQLSFSVSNEVELNEKIKELEVDNKKYESIGKGLSMFFSQNKGATEKIIDAIIPYLK